MVVQRRLRTYEGHDYSIVSSIFVQSFKKLKEFLHLVFLHQVMYCIQTDVSANPSDSIAGCEVSLRYYDRRWAKSTLQSWRFGGDERSCRLLLFGWTQPPHWTARS